MDEKGICKQLEKEKENNFESFDSLVIFWRYNEDANMHRSCCYGSLGSRNWCIIAESGRVSSLKRIWYLIPDIGPLGGKSCPLEKWNLVVLYPHYCNVISSINGFFHPTPISHSFTLHIICTQMKCIGCFGKKMWKESWLCESNSFSFSSGIFTEHASSYYKILLSMK